MNAESNSHTVGSRALISGAGTLLSRISGVVRDICFAAFLGGSDELAAFLVAFSLPNLVRRFLGEGALADAFIPLFNHRLAKEGPQAAWIYAQRILRGLMLILGSGAILFALLSWSIGQWLSLPVLWQKVCMTLPALNVFLIGICLVAFFCSILNSLGYFALSSMIPIVLNLGLILGALTAWWKADGISSRLFLAYGASLAVLGQIFLLVRFLKAKQFRMTWLGPIGWHEWRHLMRLLLPGLLAAGAYQLNVLADRLIAGTLGANAVNSLYFSERLIYFPVGILGVSFAIAGLPTMSRAAATGDRDRMWRTLGYSLTLIESAGLPTMIFLLLCARDIVSILFGYGHFQQKNVVAVSAALQVYAWGIPAFLAIRPLRNLYLAAQNT
ncbi:MAG: hypothetical protein D6820_15465, partial [Lentisphaerae bacterium]